MIFAASGFPGEGMSYDSIPLQHPTPFTGLRLLCLLVESRDGQAHYWPVRALRPMPPRVCFASAYYTNAFNRWRLEGSTGAVVNNPGLYLRETHAKRPTAQVLERCGKHRQARPFRAAARTVRAGGVSA